MAGPKTIFVRRSFRPRLTLHDCVIALVVAALFVAVLVGIWQVRRRVGFVKAAWGEYQDFRVKRQVAEIAVTQYELSFAKPWLASSDAEIERAEHDVEAAQALGEPATLDHARMWLDRTRKRKADLEKKTSNEIKSLNEKVEKARTVEEAAKGAMERAKARAWTLW
jgi:hypothetical protein